MASLRSVPLHILQAAGSGARSNRCDRGACRPPAPWHRQPRRHRSVELPGRAPLCSKGARALFSRQEGRLPKAIELLSKLLDEVVGKALRHDEPLRSRACLAGVLHTTLHCKLNGQLEVRVVQDDERIAAAELHGAFLMPLPCGTGNRGTGSVASRQSDAAHTIVSDNLSACSLETKRLLYTLLGAPAFLSKASRAKAHCGTPGAC